MKKPLIKLHLAKARHHLNLSKLHEAQSKTDENNADFHKAMAEEHRTMSAGHKEFCEAIDSDESDGKDTKKFLSGVDTNVLRDELNAREDADPVSKVRGVSALPFSKDAARRVTLVPRTSGPNGEPDLSAEPDLAELIG